MPVSFTSKALCANAIKKDQYLNIFFLKEQKKIKVNCMKLAILQQKWNAQLFQFLCTNLKIQTGL